MYFFIGGTNTIKKEVKAMGKKQGRTLKFDKEINIVSYASVVGKKEGEGPMSKYFDMIVNDEYFGEKTYEKAETRFQKTALNLALQKSLLTMPSLDMIASGDLLNQCMSSCYSVRDLGVPYVGLFGACSTMTLSMIVASMSVECGYSRLAAAITSSHFCTAERQFRQPLNYGGQRTPSAQRTVTAGAALIVGEGQGKVRVDSITIGSVIDFLIADANNMGAAMAPSACDTLCRFFEDTETSPSDYDMIYTGDLGMVGADILRDMAKERGYTLGDNYNDCGLMIFDLQKQDVHAGGSGCGCSGAVLTSYVLPALNTGRLKKVLFMSTGALMSPTATMQGESIPGVAHLMYLKGE